jgi:putative membrane protein
MLKGIIAGAIGGAAGTWAMSEAQRGWTRLVDGQPPESAAGKHDARDWQERSEGQNSNEIAAQVVARTVMGRRLDRDELAVGAALMHYTFGTAMGVLYGAYAGKKSHAGTGMAFGLAVWLFADEIAMPLLGLSDSTLRRPPEKHAQSAMSHIVFGVATELTRHAVEQLSEPSSDAPSEVRIRAAGGRHNQR